MKSSKRILKYGVQSNGYIPAFLFGNSGHIMTKISRKIKTVHYLIISKHIYSIFVGYSDRRHKYILERK